MYFDCLQVPQEGRNLVTLKTTATAERKGNVIQVTSQALSRRGYEQPCINKAFLGRKYRYYYASGMIDCGDLRQTVSILSSVQTDF